MLMAICEKKKKKKKKKKKTKKIFKKKKKKKKKENLPKAIFKRIKANNTIIALKIALVVAYSCIASV
jgi:hypothetical protein